VEFTLLTYTGLLRGLEHLKIETRLTDKKLANAMDELGDLDVIGAPSKLSVIRKAAALAKMLPARGLSLRRTPRGGRGSVHGQIPRAELLNLQRWLIIVVSSILTDFISGRLIEWPIYIIRVM
jgi:hypothetical protein